MKIFALMTSNVISNSSARLLKITISDFGFNKTRLNFRREILIIEDKENQKEIGIKKVVFFY